MTHIEKLKSAEATYNELISIINKFETIEQFLEEMGYCYDAVIHYICYLLDLKCDAVRYAYVDNAISDEYTWEELYENIHECGE